MAIQNYVPGSSFNIKHINGQVPMQKGLPHNNFLEQIASTSSGHTVRKQKSYMQGEQVPNYMLTQSAREVDVLYKAINANQSLGGLFGNINDLFHSYGSGNFDPKAEVASFIDRQKDNLTNPAYYGAKLGEALENYAPLSEQLSKIGIDSSTITDYLTPGYGIKAIKELATSKITDFVKDKVTSIRSDYGFTDLDTLTNNLSNYSLYGDGEKNGIVSYVPYGMSDKFGMESKYMSEESPIWAKNHFKQSKHYVAKTPPDNHYDGANKLWTKSYWDNTTKATPKLTTFNTVGTLFSDAPQELSTFSEGYLVSKNLFGNAMIGDLDSWHRFINKFKTYMNTSTEIDMTYATRGHIFMTRPDCNLFTNRFSDENYNGKTSSPSQRNPNFTSPMAYQATRFRYISNYLDRDCGDDLTGFEHNYNFIPFVSNLFKEFAPPSMSSTRTNGISNAQGLRFDLDVDSSNNDSNQQLSIVFKNDAMGTIGKLMGMLYDYAEHVNAGRITPKLQHIKDNAVDYAVTVFGFLVEPDGRTIRHNFKTTGLTPHGSVDGVETYSSEYKVTDTIATNWNTNLPIKYRSLEDMYQFNLQMGHSDACKNGWWSKDITDETNTSEAFNKVIIAKNIEKFEYLLYKYAGNENLEHWWTNQAMVILHAGKEVDYSRADSSPNKVGQDPNKFTTADINPRLVYLPSINLIKGLISENIAAIQLDPIARGWITTILKNFM